MCFPSGACCPESVSAVSGFAGTVPVFVSTDFIALTTGSDKVSSGYVNLFAALCLKGPGIYFSGARGNHTELILETPLPTNSGPLFLRNSRNIIRGKILLNTSSGKMDSVHCLLATVLPFFLCNKT